MINNILTIAVLSALAIVGLIITVLYFVKENRVENQDNA